MFSNLKIQMSFTSQESLITDLLILSEIDIYVYQIQFSRRSRNKGHYSVQQRPIIMKEGPRFEYITTL